MNAARQGVDENVKQLTGCGSRALVCNINSGLGLHSHNTALENSTFKRKKVKHVLKSYFSLPTGPYKFSKILDNRFAYLRKYGKIYKERLGTMNIVHIFDPRDLAAMFRNEGKHPSRGTIANLELTYLKRNNLLVGFAFM